MSEFHKFVAGPIIGSSGHGKSNESVRQHMCHGPLMRWTPITPYLCVAVLLSTGCPEPYHTSVENHTGKEIHTIVHFEGASIAPDEGGYIEPGNLLSLHERARDISFIEYRIGSQRCRLDKTTFAPASNTEEMDFTRIILRECHNPAP